LIIEVIFEGSVFSLTLKRTMCSMALGWDWVDIALIEDLDGKERMWRVRCFEDEKGM
jgi:hypothetical protein